MLYAHAGTTAEQFIGDLRTYAIAMGFNANVIDQIDNLIGADDLEAKHAKELQDTEEGAAKTAAADMKEAILEVVHAWFDAEPSYLEEIGEAITGVIEKVEVSTWRKTNGLNQ